MSDKKFAILILTNLCGIAVGTTVIYRKIDAVRHGICRQKQWRYKGMDGKLHDLI